MSDRPISIAVFGKTGAGKTSFIKRTTGADLQVGHGADSTTKEIQRVQVPPDKVGGRKVFLIDTPGFNDTDLEDPKLFLGLARWLVNSYRNSETLNGAIFLQGINEVRVSTGERNGVELFENIVGTGAFPHVVVVSTMWDQVDQDFGTSNEENRTKIWHDLEVGGAKFGRFYNTEDSAIEILHGCLEFPETTFLLQQELIDHRGKVGKTSAAVFLRRTLGTKIDDIFKQVKISGANKRVVQNLRKLKSWMRELTTGCVKLGASVWQTVVAVGMVAAVRVSVWEMH